MIELLYLNLNNNIIFDFEKNKRIQLLANNNKGKSSLYFLFKFILGGKYSLIEKDTFFEKCSDKGVFLYFEWIIKLRGVKYNVIYMTEKPNEININGKLHKTKEYKDMVDININVLGSTYSVYNVLLKENVDKIEIKNSTYMIKGKNQSHTSIFLLKLAYGNKIDSLESYFANQGKLVNIENLRFNSKKALNVETKVKVKSEYKNSVADYIHNQDDNYYSDFSEYTKLRKLKDKKYNSNIIDEISSLGIVDDISEIIEFHQKIIDDYNSIVEKRIKQLETKLFKNDKQDTELLINNINLAVSAITEKAYEDLWKENGKLDSELSEKESVFFKEIKDEYTNTLKSINTKTLSFNNDIIEARKNKKSASSLKIDISPIKNQGDGYIQVNYLYNILYFISISSYNSFCLILKSIMKLIMMNLTISL